MAIFTPSTPRRYQFPDSGEIASNNRAAGFLFLEAMQC